MLSKQRLRVCAFPCSRNEPHTTDMQLIVCGPETPTCAKVEVFHSERGCSAWEDRVSRNRVVVQDISGSMFSRTKRASPCRDYGLDADPSAKSTLSLTI